MRKNDYKNTLPEIQNEIRLEKIPVIILILGSKKIKLHAITEFISYLEPRGINLHDNFIKSEKREYPFLKCYWDAIPKKGDISIFLSSWYDDLLEKYKLDYMKRINAFEKCLEDNGYKIIKVLIKDSKQNENINKIVKYSSGWNILNSDHIKNQKELIIDTIYKCLVQKISNDNFFKINPNPLPQIKLKPIKYSSEQAKHTISTEYYDSELKTLQNELKDLQKELKKNKKSVVIAFEGFDASGKGGNIKRICHALDPRNYNAIPISAPTEEEKRYHYLYRFSKSMSKIGNFTIFDRTWYGRILVERVENFCTENEWKRAYEEINNFEYNLYKSDVILIKFWLKIDKDEQLKRFKLRENTPSKQWKITDEDWRNREKWEAYESAVTDMLSKTSTDFCKWYVIDSNNKKYARIKVLRKIISEIKKNINMDF